MMLVIGLPACASPIMARYAGSNESGGFAMLITEDGTLITPRDTYGNIHPLTLEVDEDSPRLYMASRVSLRTDDPESYEAAYQFALMDENGKLLTGFDYLTFEHYPADNVITFIGSDNRWGAMNEQGAVILKPEYICLYPNGKGGYLAQLWTGEGEYSYDNTYPIVYIDEKGRSFDTGYTAVAHGLNPFSEGYCAVNLNYGSGEHCVFLDYEGTNVFGRAYGWSTGFYGNYAQIYDNDTGLYGLIDKTGAWALPQKYTNMDSGMYSGTGTYLAGTDSGSVLLDACTLETLSEIDYGDRDITYAMLSGRYFIGAYGEYESYLYDNRGNLLFSSPSGINTWYSHADEMPERFVITEGEWPEHSVYIVDASGRKTSPAFRDLYPAVWQEGRGRYIFSTYEMAADDEGFAYPDYASYRYGLCDQDGNILLEAHYSALEVLSPDRYWVRLGPRSGMIDETGKWYYAIDDFEYLMD